MIPTNHSFIMKRQMKLTELFKAAVPDKEKRVSLLQTNANEPSDQRMDKGDSCKATPKRRKKRFSDREDHALVDEIMAHHGELFGKTTSNVLGKALIWDGVANKVNDAGETKRSVMECKKRWSDYKRKVKRTITRCKTNASLTGILEPLESFLSGRQMLIAHVFHLDSDDENESQNFSDPSSLDEAPAYGHGCQYSSKGSSIDFNENPTKEVDLLSVSSLNSDTQDNLLSSQVCDVGHSSKTWQQHIDVALRESPAFTYETSSLELANVGLKLESIITQQIKTNYLLQCIQNDVCILLSLQRKMHQLLKNNFIELQKSIMSTGKLSKDRENYMELSLRRIHRKLEEMSSILHESKLQGMMTGEETC
ncbi:uncharacterized protein myb100496870.2provisional.L [Xenopus laevis]|uniref:Uncharacterized protein myb100496870.2provisional.L n=1 Tax=Xenopus laevis TaxID=8355 RepID=A0A8J1L6P4_XENLA|nr:uncharacterized protein myb100496870.2provisional.L [Xenopus laevis]